MSSSSAHLNLLLSSRSLVFIFFHAIMPSVRVLLQISSPSLWMAIASSSVLALLLSGRQTHLSLTGFTRHNFCSRKRLMQATLHKVKSVDNEFTACYTVRLDIALNHGYVRNKPEHFSSSKGTNITSLACDQPRFWVWLSTPLNPISCVEPC